jgi:hypothetical protein
VEDRLALRGCRGEQSDGGKAERKAEQRLHEGLI